MTALGRPQQDRPRTDRAKTCARVEKAMNQFGKRWQNPAAGSSRRRDYCGALKKPRVAGRFLFASDLSFPGPAHASLTGRKACQTVH
jgi:hypothetical protein